MSIGDTHEPVTVGEKAVVIGGTSGIRRAIACGFAAEGPDVVATSRDGDRVAETIAELRELGATTRMPFVRKEDRAPSNRL